MRILMMILAVQLTSTPVPPSPGGKEALLVGYWTCVRHCPDEDIGFTIEDGKRRYASWLHSRPAIVGAEWRLQGSDLRVTRSAEVLYEWRIVHITKGRLVLREKGREGEIVLRKVEPAK